jgi:hypothetical protein
MGNRFTKADYVGSDCPDRGAADHDELGRLVQDEQIAAGHQVAADNGREDNDEADDQEHSSLSDARSQARTMSGSK